MHFTVIMQASGLEEQRRREGRKGRFFFLLKSMRFLNFTSLKSIAFFLVSWNNQTFMLSFNTLKVILQSVCKSETQRGALSGAANSFPFICECWM